jgi:hypothetical protein
MIPRQQEAFYCSPTPSSDKLTGRTRYEESPSCSSSTEETTAESLLELSSVDSFDSVGGTFIQGVPPVEIESPTKIKRPLDGQVRFRLDRKDTVVPEFCKADDTITKLSEDEVAALWWSREEMLGIQQHARSVCELYMETKADHCRDISVLLLQCAHKDSSEYCLRTNDTVRAMVHGQARGLAALMVPMFSCRRRMAVRAVLSSQASCQQQQQSVEKSEHMVSIRYQYWSRYATVWARVMADADSLFYQETALELCSRY